MANALTAVKWVSSENGAVSSCAFTMPGTALPTKVFIDPGFKPSSVELWVMLKDHVFFTEESVAYHAATAGTVVVSAQAHTDGVIFEEFADSTAQPVAVGDAVVTPSSAADGSDSLATAAGYAYRGTKLTSTFLPAATSSAMVIMRK